MAQHDMEWANQFFPAMRTDMNNALIAMATRQAGDGAPTLVAAARPNRMYLDTTRKQVLARDNADSADFIWDSWAQDRVKLWTANAAETVQQEDVNRLIIVNRDTPVTVTVPEAVGVFGAGFNTEIFNLGLGTVTITPATSTINGLASIALAQFSGAKLFSLSGQYWAALLGRGTVPTGAMMPWAGWSAPPVGFVRLMGATIGNVGSGATERAAADTLGLYTMLWTHYGQPYAPVAGGRGASAQADFVANKVMYLFDMRGRTVFGVDHGAGRLTGPVAGSLPGHVPGAVGGEQMHYPTAAEMWYHGHGFADNGHGHGIQDLAPVHGASGGFGMMGGAGEGDIWPSQTFAIAPNYSNISFGAEGGNQPHNTVPPGIAIGCWICKL